MLAHGTTTAEVKSGYGLTTESELKILEAARSMNQLHCVNLAATFMGAQAFPFECRNNMEEYVDLIVEETLPKVAEQALAEFCDVLWERGAFNLEQSKRILASGKDHGLKPKIHADQMSMLGGAEITAGIGAISVEHLNFSSKEGMKAIMQKGVIAVLLPPATFSQITRKYADARLMIDCCLPVALGTDFNAGCWSGNQQLVIAMACHFMKMTPAEAITAVTINAAHAVCRASEVGSLEVGKRADLAVFDAPNHKFLSYSFGVNLVDKVIANEDW